ncbi:MAG: hemerythrin family protein [Myxococcales bacterium]|nr:hemerythrin family protein [Myxococcales bacterium]
MAIRWTEDLAVGVGSIDQQHQEIFRRVDALLVAISRGQGKDVIDDTLVFLQEYVATHFRAEETLLRRRRYPELDAHLALHAEFERTLEDFKERFEREGVTGRMILEVVAVLTNWLEHHIAIEDKKIGAFLARSSS